MIIQMSWTDEDEEGAGTTLEWRKESFIIAAADFFKIVDNCVAWISMCTT